MNQIEDQNAKDLGSRTHDYRLKPPLLPVPPLRGEAKAEIPVTPKKIKRIRAKRRKTLAENN